MTGLFAARRRLSAWIIRANIPIGSQEGFGHQQHIVTRQWGRGEIGEGEDQGDQPMSRPLPAAQSTIGSCPRRRCQEFRRFQVDPEHDRIVADPPGIIVTGVAYAFPSIDCRGAYRVLWELWSVICVRTGCRGGSLRECDATDWLRRDFRSKSCSAWQHAG